MTDRCYGVKGEHDDTDGTEEGVHSQENTSMDGLTASDVLNQTFNSEAAGHDFYNAYAKAMGFSIRKDRFKVFKDGRVASRKWVCSRQGERSKEHLGRVERTRVPRPLTRVGCEAQFRIRYDRVLGKYIVTHFVKEHNHDLAKPHCTPFLRSHRSVRSADKAQVGAMLDVGVKTSQIMDFMVRQSGSYMNVGFIDKDLDNHIQFQRRAGLKDGDAEAALVYLCAKADVDPSFFYKFEVDDENRLTKLFWADSRSRMDYAAFGDVLVFDTTYRTNAYKKPFVILAGVNNHFQTTIFACTLLLDETVESYIWVLQVLMEAMNAKIPVSVVTDGDRAMREAIRRVLPSARHRLCNWHLQRNAVTNVHIPEFNDDFKHCMEMETDEDVFEETWNTMVEKYGLQTNNWVMETYRNRHMWAESFLRGHFFAGVKSTQRVEGMNAYFNQFLKVQMKLYEFVRHYDRALLRMRNREAEAEAITENSYPVMVTSLKPIEKHGADIFTRNMFAFFRDEILKEGKLVVERKVHGTDHRMYYVSKYAAPQSTWTVSFYPSDVTFKCCCMKFESFGLPCCHIICVMKYEHLLRLPSSCVLQRWTRIANMYGHEAWLPKVSSTLTQTARYGILSTCYNQMCYYASQTKEGFQEARNASSSMTCRMKQLCDMYKEDELKGKGFGAAQFGVRDPQLVKTKGNPGGASSSTKPPKPRRCGYCRSIGHTKRSCKKYNTSSGGLGGTSYGDEAIEIEEWEGDMDANDEENSTALPFTPTRGAPNTTYPRTPLPVQRRRSSIHPRVGMSDSQSSHDLNRGVNVGIHSTDAQVAQNSSFTIDEANEGS